MSPRIVLVVSPFPGDSEGFIVDKFLGLLDAGFDVHVLTSGSDPLERHPELAALGPDLWRRVHDLRWRDLAARLAGATTRPRIAARIIAGEVRRGRPRDARLLHGLRLASLRPDLVHLEFGWHGEELARATAALGVPSVVSLRGADLNYVGLDDPHHYDEVWSTVDAVHCLGADLWARAQRRGCPPGLRHVLIPPAVDAERFRPEPRPDRQGPLRVLSVGRLHWKKGHEFALAAVATARDRGLDLRYRIIGDGSHRPAIEAAISAFGLGDVVTLEGTGSRDSVRAAMQDSDLCLHAAVSEGFCNTVLEAQAMALPVITTDADGLAENIEPGVTGVVVPRRDPEAMAACLLELGGEPDRRRRLGEAGRTRVLERFRPADQIAAFVALYEELLGSD